jgi:predicted nucleotidyltransferase
MTNSDYPGTAQHQALLQGIVDHYAADARVRAVVVFGSLGRGNWDAGSDIDLDVVIGDGLELEVEPELQALCDALAKTGEKKALAFAIGPDEGEIVFESLMQISVRYHTLATTKAAIVDTMKVLSGELDGPSIAAAGLANQVGDELGLRLLLDHLLRYAAVTAVAVRRENLWLAIELLGRMRALCLEIFTRARGGERSYYYFAQAAEAQLQDRIGQTLPEFDLASIRRCLLVFVDILEQEMEALAGGRLSLRPSDRRLLEQVRSNQRH